MVATNFTRCDCQLNGRRVTYQTLKREYYCNECMGRLVTKWDETRGVYITCGLCGSFDFVHGARVEREQWHRIEVADSLPAHITDELMRERKETDMIKDRNRRRERLTRAGIIRLGYRAFKCRADRCSETIPWRPGPIACPRCGFVNRNVDQQFTFPMQADHFVLRDAPEIQDYYGPNGEPVREIDVLMLFPDVARNFDASYQVWAGGVIVCEGDGECVTRARPMVVQEKADRTAVHQGSGQDLVRDSNALAAFKWGEREFAPGDRVPCPGSEGIRNGGYPQCAACRMSALLKVSIAAPDVFRYAYYQIATGSWRNYDTVLSALGRVRGDHQDPVTGEEIAGTRPVNTVRFKLRLAKQASTYFNEQTGKVAPVDKYFLQMEPYRDDMLHIIAAERAALMGVAAPRMLPAGNVEQDEQDDLFDLGPGEVEYIDADLEDVEVETPAPPPFAEVERDTSVVDYFSDDQAPESPARDAPLPTWVSDLRRQANNGEGASDPESVGAITGLIKGLANRAGRDEEQVRRFLTALWGCPPEDLTRRMYRLTVNLNGELQARMQELESIGTAVALPAEPVEEDIPF